MSVAIYTRPRLTQTVDIINLIYNLIKFNFLGDANGISDLYSVQSTFNLCKGTVCLLRSDDRYMLIWNIDLLHLPFYNKWSIPYWNGFQKKHSQTERLTNRLYTQFDTERDKITWIVKVNTGFILSTEKNVMFQ